MLDNRNSKPERNEPKPKPVDVRPDPRLRDIVQESAGSVSRDSTITKGGSQNKSNGTKE